MKQLNTLRGVTKINGDLSILVKMALTLHLTLMLL